MVVILGLTVLTFGYKEYLVMAVGILMFTKTKFDTFTIFCSDIHQCSSHSQKWLNFEIKKLQICYQNLIIQIDSTLIMLFVLQLGKVYYSFD